ncbi:MAG: hypothetical protein M3Q16_08665 [Pseudomonadota bacterium]|nr:hypothetical protein [Pseudomonadota bacterium]
MKTKKIPAITAVLGLLVSCTPMSPYEAIDSPVLHKAVQNARTSSDHDALAKNFENLAREMQLRAAEQRRLFEHYQDKGYLYGRQAQDQQSHTWALMHRYEQAVEKSFAKAAAHRQMAAELARDDARDEYASRVRQNTNAPTAN